MSRVLMIRRIGQLEQKFSELSDTLSRIETEINALECGLTDGKGHDKFENADGFGNLEERIKELEIHSDGKKSFIHQFEENVTSLVGLTESVHTKSPVLKCIWASIFVFCIAFTAYFLFLTTSEYLVEPTITKVRLRESPLYEYPPIVLCPSAWFDTNKALSLGLSLDALKFSLGYTSFAYFRTIDNVTIENLTEARSNFLQVFHQHKFQNLLDFFMAISTDMEARNSTEAFYDSDQPSYYASNTVKKVFLPFSSICHSFHLPPVDADLGLFGANEEIMLKFSDRTEGVITAPPSWDLNTYEGSRSMYAWPTVIRTSVKTIIKIQATRYTQLNKARAPCIDTSDPTKIATACMAQCAISAHEERVGCRVFWLFPNQTSFPAPIEHYCNTMESSLINSAEFERREWDELVASVKEYCVGKCGRTCDRTLYEAEIKETIAFNTYQKEKATEAKDLWNMSITIIEFGLKAVHQGGVLTVREVETYSLTQLLNNVGGTLGLFVGATIMTLVQVIMFFVEYFGRKE